ncbi:hypothetical protein, partial [Thauera butanivorans]|uniref:hypothetical protein n=1 Tax=Thauera butanivorans TaxID=86174 RepID=UPI000A46FE5B
MKKRVNMQSLRCPADDILDRVLSGKGAGEIVSLREAYVTITGDERMSGQLADCNKMRYHNFLGTAETRFT